jgi:hypothetical protein
LRIVIGVAMLLAFTIAASFCYAAWEYTTWRDRHIEWDYGTIDRLCGGDTEEDRLLDIQLVKQWEYRALKRTPDGKEVWIHWNLSKRECGNWMLVDPSQRSLIRPFTMRFPNGAPHREAVSCVGIPIDESEMFKGRDEVAEVRRRTNG